MFGIPLLLLTSLATSSLLPCQNAQDERTKKPAPEAQKKPDAQKPAKPIEKAVFDFRTAEQKIRWFAVNDDVMGGISKSSFERHKEGYGVFSGRLSLANNGGFATVRSKAADLGLEGMKGLEIRVRGDGRTYRLAALLTSRRMEIRLWQTSFKTEAGKWLDIRIPFSELTLSMMGIRFPRAKGIDPAKIRSLSFSIADKNEKPFELDVQWIKAYGSVRRRSV